MRITYENVLKYRKSNELKTQYLLKEINDIMVQGRDERKIPIYMTKYRIKSADSIYLKAKRDKIETLSEIIDLAGFRIVCLFEQDIIDVNNFIVDSLNENGFNLSHFKIFNWPDNQFTLSLKNIIDISFEHVQIITKEKSSKYKSLHYIFNRRDQQVEIRA